MAYKVSVIGQGYVGLPLSLAAARAGHEVFGIDTESKKVKLLNEGVSTVEDILSDQVLQSLSTRKYLATTLYSYVEDSEIICICVPTPLGVDRQPDLGPLKAAVLEVGKNLKQNSLVIIESTIQPTTTRNVLIPILERESKLSRDEFLIAYSPERIDPLNYKWNIENTPKLVAGLNESSVNKAVEFYSSFIEKVEICSSLEVAETAKLLENSFRFINISFINEISMFCQKLGIDILDVINAASSKPYGFMPFYPSIGVGGHCIPVDPLYLTNMAREIGAPTRFIDLADQINQELPDHFVRRAEEKIGGLKGKKILIIGVSYKPNVADVRETPVEALIAGVKNKGAEVFWHDDLVKEWNGEKSVALSSDYDLAIIATPHDYLDLSVLRNVPILDTRGSI